MQTVDKKYFLFNKGINTEAPLVGWPEGYTIDEQNFDLLMDGSRRRRPGLSPEIWIPPVVPEVPELPPVVPEGGEPDCFDLYTTTSDHSRTMADGFILDPELQFTTEANKTYWMYGKLKFQQTNSSGSPGHRVNFYHAGETIAFQSMASQSNNYGSGDRITTTYWEPIDESRMDKMAMFSSTVGTSTFYHVHIDCILKVGASGGIFGIKWGTQNSANPLGTTALKQGSYFTAIEVLDN